MLKKRISHHEMNGSRKMIQAFWRNHMSAPWSALEEIGLVEAQLWAMLGIYTVGVVAVCLVAVILPLITNADAGQR